MSHKILIVVLVSMMLLMSGAAVAAPGIGKYHDVDVALADGYVADDHCVPGMGYHYGNFGLIGDGEVSVSQPEVLVYATGEDGLELVAAEYLAFVEFSLLGQESEAGPFPGSHALHAWFFLPNEDGLTHHTNSKVDANCNIVD